MVARLNSNAVILASNVTSFSAKRTKKVTHNLLFVLGCLCMHVFKDGRATTHTQINKKKWKQEQCRWSIKNSFFYEQEFVKQMLGWI